MDCAWVSLVCFIPARGLEKAAIPASLKQTRGGDSRHHTTRRYLDKMEAMQRRCGGDAWVWWGGENPMMMTAQMILWGWLEKRMTKERLHRAGLFDLYVTDSVATGILRYGTWWWTERAVERGEEATILAMSDLLATSLNDGYFRFWRVSTDEQELIRNLIAFFPYLYMGSWQYHNGSRTNTVRSRRARATHYLSAQSLGH
jgi:hypothetical protein